MIATGRPFAGWHGSHTGRTPRSRNARVNDGYDRSYPRSVTSSNNAVAHRCGSSASRALQYAAYAANVSAPAGARTPTLSLPVQVGADRSPVLADMPGDRRDRPAPPAQCVDVHVVLLCEHEAGPLRIAGVWSRDRQHRRGPAVDAGATQGGDFQ